MKTRSASNLVAILIAFLSSSHGQASGPIPSALDFERKVLALQSKSKPKVAANQCLSFAGKWEGVCESTDGSKSQKSMEINQTSCSSLEFISQNSDKTLSRTSLDLSTGIEGKTSSGFLFGLGTHYAAAWNSERDLINIEGVVLAKIVGQAIYHGHVSAQLMMDQDQLLQTASIDGNLPGSSIETCRYNKK